MSSLNVTIVSCPKCHAPAGKPCVRQIQARDVVLLYEVRSHHRQRVERARIVARRSRKEARKARRAPRKPVSFGTSPILTALRRQQQNQPKPAELPPPSAPGSGLDEWREED